MIFMAKNNCVSVEVAYATPVKQLIINIELSISSTIRMAIEHSGILHIFPEIDLTKQKIGIFGKERLLSDRIKAGDRIEIYRPLLIEPKEIRRRKAKNKQ